MSGNEAVGAEDLLDLLERKGHLLVGVRCHEAEADERVVGGHGGGAERHEEPEVPNYGTPGHGVRLIPGMTIAVEPMVNLGGAAIRVLQDGWTVVTEDGKPSAHYENTILITRGDPEILTPIQGDGGDGI